VRREEPLGQSRPAGERVLEPLDLQQVQADAGHAGGRVPVEVQICG
jgi:hypothetical protein